MSRAIVLRSLAPGMSRGPAKEVTNGISLGFLGLGQMLAVLALAACSSGSTSSGAGWAAVGPSGTATEGRPGLATQLACRQRANEMFDRRNRTDIYAANSSVNTPFSSSYLPGVSSRGLSGQFAYEQTVAECERNSGTGSERTEAPVPPRSAPSAAKGR